MVALTRLVPETLRPDNANGSLFQRNGLYHVDPLTKTHGMFTLRQVRASILVHPAGAIC
jgi:hypothetical protein